ncbi:MAG: carbohydrate-binding family 9-like protein, partial [Lentisphaeria bacterium]|nr:carbohydrate-binding family 9-like protein [Lentisphaeria bacterium]
MMRMVQALVAVVLVGGMCSCVRFRLNPWARPAKEAAATEVTAAVAPVPEAAIAVPSPTLICKRTPAPIMVDGRREVLWDHGIAVTRFFVPPGCTEPLSKTEVSCMWDDKALYVLFQAQDKDVWSDLLERDDSTYLNDVLEFFIAYGDFDDELQYVNFEVNALG